MTYGASTESSTQEVRVLKEIREVYRCDGCAHEVDVYREPDNRKNTGHKKTMGCYEVDGGQCGGRRVRHRKVGEEFIYEDDG